jgi:hypothetical protein
VKDGWVTLTLLVMLKHRWWLWSGGADHLSSPNTVITAQSKSAPTSRVDKIKRAQSSGREQELHICALSCPLSPLVNLRKQDLMFWVAAPYASCSILGD